MRSFLFYFILCVACAHLFCGCEKDDSPASPPEQVVHNPASNVLAWPLSAPVTSFDPIAATNIPEGTVIVQIFDTLVRFDQNLSLAPGIAKKWKVDPTGREYTFDLKAGIVFHDGSALTATKVKLSLERLARAGKKTFLYKHLKMIEGCEAFSEGRAQEICGIQALNPLQIRIRLKQPHAPFLSALGISQAGIVSVPDDCLEAEGCLSIVGSGPFVPEAADSKHIILRPFARFIDGPPRLGGLVFRVYNGSNIRRAVEDFLVGELSAVPMFGPVDSMLRGKTDYQVIRRSAVGLFFYGFNMHKNSRLTASMRMRIAQALDKRALFANDNMIFIAENLIPIGLAGYRPHRIAPDSNENHNPLSALPERIRMLSVARSSEIEAEMAYLAKQLHTLGSELEVEYVLDWEEFYKRLSAGDCDMFRLAWYPDTPDLDEMFFPLFHSQGEYNYFGYSNPRVDALLEQARAMSRQEERILLYQQAEDIILQDLPSIPISYANLDRAIKPNVHGLSWSPFGELYNSFASVWIE
ncbi:ABC transporter substrate-binding protein [Desulfocurvibacter africanus]|uniref:ABC transporter substrate-binding protein n=1 Tax=Desulfocurvibacter africanus TaxID=873 RepID=UPI00040D73BE|nr:ABC transporter substrate-binding protein [Desulfocurvibacter africanus]